MKNNDDLTRRLAEQEGWKSRNNVKTFDPMQESHEEYLRRIHLDDKLNDNVISFKEAAIAVNEWKIDEKEKEFNNKTITEPE
tara:strand:- start:1757 stop:2002 length:246 start_codon:yes stop_codon:yes gene_type:complete